MVGPEKTSSDAFLCCLMLILVCVLCNNQKNWVSVNGLGRGLDTAAGSWKKTRGSGLRPLVGPLARRHARRRWEQRNKAIVKRN